MPFDSRSNYQGANYPMLQGPVAKLGWGSGRRGVSPLPGSQTILPSYAQVYYYQPSFFGYYPKYRRNYQFLPPMQSVAANDGRELVGTYNPHDFTVGQRQLSHMRRAAYWQIQEFPPNYRNLLEALKVERFRTESRTVAARPLLAENFFLGYQTNPTLAGRLGYSGGGMGVLGSV